MDNRVLSQEDLKDFDIALAVRDHIEAQVQEIERLRAELAERDLNNWKACRLLYPDSGLNNPVELATRAFDEIVALKAELKKTDQDYQDYIHTIRLNIPAEFTKQPQLDLCMQRLKEAVFEARADLDALKKALHAVKDFFDAIETCHICSATVLIEDGPVHCETCASNCEEHQEPDCASLEVLFNSAKRGLVTALSPGDSAPAKRPRIICLCGSTRFIDTWINEYQRLSDEGNIVLTVARMPPRPNLQHEQPELKLRLDELHKRKIDLADEVYVLNVGGYIGSSTRGEIEYAESHGKPVLYLDAAPAAPTAEPNTAPPVYDPEFPLYCGTCRSRLKWEAFNGHCPVCGNGTVRDLTPVTPAAPEPTDPDALTGCADDQRFGAAEVGVIRSILSPDREWKVGDRVKPVKLIGKWNPGIGTVNRVSSMRLTVTWDKYPNPHNNTHYKPHNLVLVSCAGCGKEKCECK